MPKVTGSSAQTAPDLVPHKQQVKNPGANISAPNVSTIQCTLDRDSDGESYRDASINKDLWSPYGIQDTIKVTKLNVLTIFGCVLKRKCEEPLRMCLYAL